MGRSDRHSVVATGYGPGGQALARVPRAGPAYRDHDSGGGVRLLFAPKRRPDGRGCSSLPSYVTVCDEYGLTTVPPIGGATRVAGPWWSCGRCLIPKNQIVWAEDFDRMG
jgi:hypothetical protein